LAALFVTISSCIEASLRAFFFVCQTERMMDFQEFASVPMRFVGPLRIIGSELDEDVLLPLATYETPLWASVSRGARAFSLAGGISVTVLHDAMTRSVVCEADSAENLRDVTKNLPTNRAKMEAIVAKTGRFAHLQEVSFEIVGSLLFMRFAMTTGDAAGHNMVTKAAEALLSWLLETFPSLRYVSISGNLCTDKKVSAANGLLKRGKAVVAEALLSDKICQKVLKTTPEKIVAINTKKNLIGSTLAGSTRSANAHFANMLLGIYLATGQDCANIVEGSQGITYAERRGADLYFSVTLPNVIVGTVGNGKNLPFVQENLKKLGCLPQPEAPGQSSRRLAAIVAGAVACGELSLLAAQTNPGELVRAHMRLERGAPRQRIL
jgi:hydroxymethylglutaryl-CoA reductase (NADPH)